jgi:hypothetical protein
LWGKFCSDWNDASEYTFHINFDFDDKIIALNLIIMWNITFQIRLKWLAVADIKDLIEHNTNSI